MKRTKNISLSLIGLLLITEPTWAARRPKPTPSPTPAPVLQPTPTPTPVASPLPSPTPANLVGVNCNEFLSNPLAAPTDSINFQYFTDLYNRATQNPDSVALNDYLKLWYPDKVDAVQLNSPFFSCETQPGGDFVQQAAVPDTCKPDVLFSWHDHYANILTRFPDNPVTTWSGTINPNGTIASGTMFTSISAVSTSAYGANLLRFKIKKGTAYNFENFGANPGEVGIRTQTYHDFAIQDPSIVESISFGTPEMYDEVVHDLLRYQSPNPVEDYNAPSGTGMDRLYGQVEDGHPNSEADLKAKLLGLIKLILTGQGEIHYNQGVCRNRALTFTTQFPSYIDPLTSIH